jgi:hypothetical protein
VKLDCEPDFPPPKLTTIDGNTAAKSFDDKQLKVTPA